MAQTIGELIKELQEVASQYGDDLEVVTKSWDAYNDEPKWDEGWSTDVQVIGQLTADHAGIKPGTKFIIEA